MKSKLRPIFRSILLTYIAQAVILVGALFIYHLIGKSLGPEGVGEYSLIKRAVSLLSPLLLLGLGMGIPRYVAMSRDREQRSAYMRAGLVAIFFTLIFSIFLCSFKTRFSLIIFGDTEYVVLILPLTLFLAGSILHSLVYSYFRGRLLVKIFNSLHIMNLGVSPVLILLLFNDITIEGVITLMGIATVGISVVFFLLFGEECFIHIGKLQLGRSLGTLLRYSVPRIAGSFALAGFFSLGPILAGHFASIEAAGYLSISETLLSTVATAIAPLGLILLPKVSSMVAQGETEKLQEHLNYLIGASIQLSIFASVQLVIFSDTIIQYWLGPEFLGAIPVMRIVASSTFFYLFYRTVGSILDAARVKPINTINLSISLGLFLAVSGILLLSVKSIPPIIVLSIGVTSGLICLGGLSYVSVRKLYSGQIRQDLYYLVTAIGINAMLAGIAVLAKPFVVLRAYYFIGFEILAGTMYLSILWLLKMDWLRKAPERVLL